MNVDKFGHYVHKRLRLSEILDFSNKSLSKTEHGDFDLQQRRLKGIRHPITSDEAVNKEYVDKIIHNYLTKAEVEDLVFSTIKKELIKYRTELYTEFCTKRELKHFTDSNKNVKTSSS